MSRQIRVTDHYSTCATRGRGREFYSVLLQEMDNVPSWGEIVLTFEGVEFVSPSFLDETLVRLARERPGLASRVVIQHLSDFSAERLRVALDRRGLRWTLTARPSGEYAFSA